MKRTRKDKSASAVFNPEDIMPGDDNVTRLKFGSSYQAEIDVGRL